MFFGMGKNSGSCKLRGAHGADIKGVMAKIDNTAIDKVVLVFVTAPGHPAKEPFHKPAVLLARTEKSLPAARAAAWRVHTICETQTLLLGQSVRRNKQTAYRVPGPTGTKFFICPLID